MTARQGGWRAALAAWRARRAWKPVVADDDALRAVLAELCGAHRQPAMGAALVVGDRIAASASAGVIAVDREEPVGRNSRFHIGSTTKTMTALIIAQLVHHGRLRYDATLGELLGDLAMREAYRRVTVRDLLLSKAGIIAMQDTRTEDTALVDAMWKRIPEATPDATAQRTAIASLALERPPIRPPGTANIYSNVGWAVAALAAERAAGESFEALLEHRVFAPLGMTGARVGGWPATVAEPLQPHGHYVEGAGHRMQPLDDEYVFPAWMNPAGGVHCTVDDLARYVRDQLAGLRGRGSFPGCYREPHTIQDTVNTATMYALGADELEKIYGDRSGGLQAIGYGWGVAPLAEGSLSVADGSGGTFFARMVVFPALATAFAGVTNTGNGARALDDVIQRVSGFAWRSA